MIESDADRLAAIKSLGGQLISHDSGSFVAIFENDFVSVVEGMVESRGPALTALSSDVKDLPKDTVLTIGDVEYRIKRLEHDGSGMTVLLLKL
jgi:hypothetical protein